MGRLTVALCEELATYFHTALTGEVAAQTYEPGSHTTYTPITDKRLVHMMSVGRATREWARVRRIVDELSPPHVEVLRLACSTATPNYNAVAWRLPEARAIGLTLAEDLAREAHLRGVYDSQRRIGATGLTLASHVLQADLQFSPRVSEADVTDATRRAIELGHIDVSAHAVAVVDAAVDAYTAMRDRLDATKRADATRRRRESAERLDRELGILAEKASRRFERKLRRAS